MQPWNLLNLSAVVGSPFSLGEYQAGSSPGHYGKEGGEGGLQPSGLKPHYWQVTPSHEICTRLQKRAKGRGS